MGERRAGNAEESVDRGSSTGPNVPFEHSNDAVSIPIQAQDEGPGKSPDHLGKRGVGVPAKPVQRAGQEVPDVQHAQKIVEEERTSKVRQTRMVKGRFDVSWGVSQVRAILTSG